MNVQCSHQWCLLLSLQCSARVRHCLRLLVKVVHWCASRLVRLICCQIILTAIKQSREAVDLATRLLVLPPSPSGRVRSDVSCQTWTLMVALTHCVCFLFLLRELLMLWPPVLVQCFLGLSVWVVSQLTGDMPTPIHKGALSSSVTNYRPIAITSVFSRPLGRLSAWCRFVLDDLWTQCCASTYPVCLSEMSGYLGCTFVRVPCTEKVH